MIGKKYRVRFLPIIFGLSWSFISLKISYAENTLITDPFLYEIQGYAIASCLTEQKDDALVDQGYRWAEAIIQSSSKYNFETISPITEVVEKEISKNDMFMMRVEETPYKAKALPIYYCYAMAAKPSVQEAILKAYQQLKD